VYREDIIKNMKNLNGEKFQVIIRLKDSLMNRKVLYTFLLMVFLLCPAFSWGATETVRLPLTLDYTLIRSLFHVQASINQEESVLGNKRRRLQQHRAGNRPFARSIVAQNQHQHQDKGGCKGFGNVCNADWEGTLKILQGMVDKILNSLRFTTIKSPIFDKMESLAKVRIWDVIRTMLFRFDDLSIDLASGE
jgi:hypothetical protein